MIADDSREKILLLREMLTRAGWNGTVLQAMTTEEAKKIIDDNPDIAAAFIDFYIPSENGPAIIAYLRARCPKSRIALVSSGDSPENSALAQTAGAEIAISTSHEATKVERMILDLLHSWIQGT